MTRVERRVSVHGAMAGPIWWPIGQKCGVPVSKTFDRETIREIGTIGAIEHMLTTAGDFSEMPKLTADSYIQIDHVVIGNGRQVCRSRLIEVADLPSLADLVDADSYASDFE